MVRLPSLDLLLHAPCAGRYAPVGHLLSLDLLLHVHCADLCAPVGYLLSFDLLPHVHCALLDPLPDRSHRALVGRAGAESPAPSAWLPLATPPDMLCDTTCRGF